MRKLVLASVAGAVFVAAALAAQATGPIGAAVADKSRPADQVALDEARKPAATLAFAGVKAGDKVADYFAAGGYFTRLFVDVVGPKGHVYAVEPSEGAKFLAKDTEELNALAKTKPTLTVMAVPAMEGLKYSQKLDVFWIAQNYHDLHDKFMGPVDIVAFNKGVYDALKPGGVYIVLDHSAPKGSGLASTDTTHRIDEDQVKKEVEAAGFKLEAESDILRNPADTRDKLVFDKSIRHHTDQFLLKFRKPRK